MSEKYWSVVLTAFELIGIAVFAAYGVWYHTANLFLTVVGSAMISSLLIVIYWNQLMYKGRAKDIEEEEQGCCN